MKKFMKTAGWQIGAFVLAIGAAFATNAMKDNTMFVTEDGYLPMNTEATICDYKIESSTDGIVFCTWQDPITLLNHRVYGKITDPLTLKTKCIKTLFKR